MMLSIAVQMKCCITNGIPLEFRIFPKHAMSITSTCRKFLDYSKVTLMLQKLQLIFPR